MADAGRVIAGAARGIRLLAPGEGTRPLGDRVKQTLFATLGAGAGNGPFPSFLDLFAGSGAAGIEALSRGAPEVLFVERDPLAARVISANLRRASLDGGRVLRRDVSAVLREGRSGAGAPFGAAFIDPPYAEPASMNEVLTLLADTSKGWLIDGATVVAKHFWRSAPEDSFGPIQLARRRRFGETALSYYRYDMSRHESGL